MEVDLGGVSRIRSGCGGLLTVVCRYTQYSGKWDEAYERLMNGRGACGLSVGRRVMKVLIYFLLLLCYFLLNYKINLKEWVK